MIPLKDENPTHSFPVLTLGLIGLNCYVFFYGLTQYASPEILYINYGLVPVHLIQSPVSAAPTLFSSMFLHAGWMHLAGNMLYLWIFGNNIEDHLGKIRFLMFYFACGIVAALGHIGTNLGSPIPMVGASGAISGILGAYLVLYPYARIRTLIFLGFFITVIRVPAVILLLLWIGIQVGSGLMEPGEGGGVAWFAHVGGFIAGMIFILPFRKPRYYLL